MVWALTLRCSGRCSGDEELLSLLLGYPGQIERSADSYVHGSPLRTSYVWLRLGVVGRHSSFQGRTRPNRNIPAAQEANWAAAGFTDT